MTLIWRPGYMPLDDPDAADYIAAVEAADELASPGIGALEDEVKAAIHAFVKGCKNDGIWDAIKASCILAGAKTTSGALVPLVGTVPTPYNFDLVTDTDYNRKTGLVGDGSTKYLDTGFASDAIEQNNRHSSCFVTQAGGNTTYYLGVNSVATAYNTINAQSPNMRFGTCSNLQSFIATGSSVAINFVGWSRQTSTSAITRVGGGSESFLISSVSPSAVNWFAFCRNNNGTAFNFTNARLSFYSIGESLDLAALDGRVTDLMTALGAAIP